MACSPREQSSFANGLIAAMDPAAFAELRSHLVPAVLAAGEVLTEPGAVIDSLYFPETGLVSFVSGTEIGIELGIVGREGVAGASVALAVDTMPLQSVGQLAGEGHRLPASALRAAITSSSALRDLLCRFTHCFTMQVASTAYANAHFTVEQRLARWLLMAHDRMSGDEVRLTHDFLAVMLCVRRPGVTVATHVLEGHGAIRAMRGRITIRDRRKLEEFAEDSYGVAEAEYRRLIGRMPGIVTDGAAAA